MKKFLTSVLLFTTLYTFSFSQVGKVGINTTIPTAMLHVKDSSVLFSSPYYENFPEYDAPPPVSGAGARMMWYPQHRSLRTGMVTGTQWNQSNTGFYSFASGYNPIANGEVATAIGKEIIANGFSGLVIGHCNDPIINTPQNFLDPTTPLFIIGNGDNPGNRSNAMVALKNGRIGIGTNVPSDLLHLNAASGDPLRVQVAGSTKLRVWNNGGTSIGSATTPAINGLFVNGPIEPASGIVSATRPIRIESTTDSIEITAGNNRIVVFANGGIKIITSGAGNNITIDAGSNQLNLKGATINIDATNVLNLTSENVTNVVGSQVKFNGGSTPVAKLGSTVQVNPATGAGTVVGNGSPTVVTQ